MFRIDLAIFTFYVVMYYRKKRLEMNLLRFSFSQPPCASQSGSVGVQLIPGDGSTRHGAQGATDSTVMDKIKCVCRKNVPKIVSTCFYPNDRLPNPNPISGHKAFLKVKGHHLLGHLSYLSFSARSPSDVFSGCLDKLQVVVCTECLCLNTWTMNTIRSMGRDQHHQETWDILIYLDNGI